MNDPINPPALVAPARSPLALQAIAARLRAEGAEQAVVSPSRWEEAECYLGMHEREGKSTRQIAAECETNQSTVNRMIRMASHYGLKNERPPFWTAYAEAKGENSGKEPAAVAHVGQATGQPEWYTPPEYLEASREVLGGIDLDPASSEVAQASVRAGRFFTADDDGLTKPWKGRVFLNPPYAAELVGRFVEKLCSHYEAGDVTAAILLVNNATETAWFFEASQRAAALCLPTGRVKFLDEEGNPGAPLQGQAVLYFGGDVPAFRGVWAPFGPVWLPGR
jgi:ParB family chromosome partitioning protein